MPFTREQFLEVFRDYNEGVWPAQLVLIGLAVLALVVTIRTTPRSTTVTASVLTGLWLWMAVAYHWIYFAAINPAAWVFGAMFVAQAVLLAWSTAAGRLRFGLARTWSAWIGVGIIVYAVLLYPLLGELGDHAYPRSPSFGLPCPTTTFTLGMLLLTSERVPKRLLVVPVLWAALGSVAPFVFGIWEDLGLTVAAVATVVVLTVRDRVRRHELTASGAHANRDHHAASSMAEKRTRTGLAHGSHASRSGAARRSSSAIRRPHTPQNPKLPEDSQLIARSTLASRAWASRSSSPSRFRWMRSSST